MSAYSNSAYSNMNPKLAAQLAVVDALDAYALSLYERAKARAEALKAKQ